MDWTGFSDIDVSTSYLEVHFLWLSTWNRALEAWEVEEMNDTFSVFHPHRTQILSAGVSGAPDTSDVEFAATPVQSQPYPWKPEVVAY
jgi:hypothetical protein